MNRQFGFIGCGNMGGALAVALSKSISAQSILLCDTNAEKAEQLANQIGAVRCDLATVVKQADFLFLGVKPQGFEGLFEVLRPLLKQKSTRTVLISMAAGIGISAVESFAGMEIPVIRIMPNTPVSVGEGMILYAANSHVAADEIEAFCNGMSLAGRLDLIDEAKIDAASALSGCGPAFVYLFAEALADGAVECGLARDAANLYAAQTLLGAAKLLLESGMHPGALKDAVCSPGGTTIAGVHALEEGAFRASAMNAVKAAYEKTLKLKK